jgi:hypothetical protein
MARTQKQQTMDRAKAKAQKQKRLAIILCGVLLLVLVYEVPHTLKMLKHSPSSAVASGAAPPAVTSTPTTTTPGVAPSPSGEQASATPETNIVASVQPTPDPGQLTQFTLFASKDPFDAKVLKRQADGGVGGAGAATSGTSGSGSSTSSGPSSAPTTTPKPPPAPAPTSAVISLNGELMAVSTGSAFPVSGATFDRVGSLFQLVSLTAKSAKVSIVGGSYADGSAALTLDTGKPVTLQNTADGTRYTLVLEPQGTPPPSSTTTGTVTTPAPTTTPSVVPSSPSG